MAVDTTLDVTVTWHEPGADEDWDVARTLYAHLDPDTGEIMYLGKADYCSARVCDFRSLLQARGPRTAPLPERAGRTQRRGATCQTVP